MTLQNATLSNRKLLENEIALAAQIVGYIKGKSAIAIARTYLGGRTLSLHAITHTPSAAQKPAKLLVALHGWGANAQDLASLAPYLNLPDYQMLFPDAPFPHPQAPGGRMWYRLPIGYDFQNQPDFVSQTDLAESRQLLTTWLQNLEPTVGIPLSQTILAGFSQGGAMTLDVGLQLPLAGLIVLSGYLHAPVKIESPICPVLVIHGQHDPVVPLAIAQRTQKELTLQGVAVRYYELTMGHEVQPEALNLIREFCEIL